MAAVERVTLPSWDRFKAELCQTLFGEARFREDRYLFRGQGDAEWSLISRFDRFAEGMEAAQRPAAAQELLEAFVEECDRDAAIDPCPEPWKRRLALAQHHGLPTRALDWTESPYIAAHFAFADVLPGAGSGQVAIWALDLEHDAWQGPGAEILSAHGRDNERLLRQRGAFTYLAASHGSLEEYVEGLPAGRSAALLQFRLPRSEVTAALADLRAMGISSTRLFADRTGAARAALARCFS